MVNTSERRPPQLKPLMKTVITFVVAIVAANAIGLTLVYNAGQNIDWETVHKTEVSAQAQ